MSLDKLLIIQLDERPLVTLTRDHKRRKNFKNIKYQFTRQVITSSMMIFVLTIRVYPAFDNECIIERYR